MKFTSKSEHDTYNLGKTLALQFKKGDVVLLEGELGAGKSVFIRGVAAGLGITEQIPSPTFTIVNEYCGNAVKINHFDFYRITDSYELYEIGFEDYIYSDAISFIEWPSKGKDLLPNKFILIKIIIESSGKRVIIIDGEL